jgi:hypothetical protein
LEQWKFLARLAWWRGALFFFVSCAGLHNADSSGFNRFNIAETIPQQAATETHRL